MANPRAEGDIKGTLKKLAETGDPKDHLIGLDLPILEALPEEGTKLGHKTLAPQVKSIKERLNKGVPPEGRITSDEISARLRIMSVFALVAAKRVPPVSRGNGWQRTAKAGPLIEWLREANLD